MNPIRLALIQAAYDPAPDAMARKYALLVADAARTGAKIVVLPELSITEYFPQTPAAEREVEALPENVPGGPSCRLFAELAKDNGIFVIGSVYERGGLGFRKQKGARFNTTIVFDPEGRAGAACRKQHLAVGGAYEPDYFQKGNSDYPLFGLPDVRMATPTGYDLWFPELVRILALKGAELIAAPAALGDDKNDPATNSLDAWTAVLRSHAITNGLYVAAANRVGTETSLVFRGGSLIAGPNGEILAQGSSDGEEVVSAEIDSVAIQTWRDRHLFLLQREPETYQYLMGRLVRKEAEGEEAEAGPATEVAG